MENKYYKQEIGCNVESCMYNKSGRTCEASKIDVSAMNNCPSCCADTMCRTYEEK